MIFESRFAGRTAVVIGGGRGIGRAIATRLGAEGADVIVADHVEDLADEVVASIRDSGGTADTAVFDAADASAVGRFFYALIEERGCIDILVNCPARASDTPFERVTENEFDQDMAATLKAPFLCIQAAIPLLFRSVQGPNVVTIGSVNGEQAFGNEVYGAAKAGVVNLTKNLAVRYGPRGLRFNVVAPGTVHTSSWDERVAAEPDVLERVAASYPLGRVGKPDDIAAACLFLASDDAAWITGQTLTVDGGLTAGHPGIIDAIFGNSFFGAHEAE